MKKGLLFSLIIFFVAIVAPINVAALKDSDIKFHTAIDTITYDEYKYDEENNIHYAKATVYVTDESLNAVLNQKPGSGGNLSSFYVGLEFKDYVGKHFEKSSSWVKIADNKTLEEKKEAAKVQLTPGGANDSLTTMWITGLMVQYKGADGWVTPNTASTGDGTSVGQNLQKLLGIAEDPSFENLIYGKNFRVYMFEQYESVTAIKDNDTQEVEYVFTTYELVFPVNAYNEDGVLAYYYPSVELALGSESKDLVVKHNVNVGNNITIPEGTKLTIDSGVTVTVSEDVTVTNEGTLAVKGDLKLNTGATLESTGKITNTGSITVAGKSVYTINAKDDVIIQDTFATVGTTVTFSVNSKKGYVAVPKVVKAGKKTVKVTDNEDGTYSFKMPSSNVTISVSYKEPSEVNPDTADTLKAFELLSVISLFGLTLTSLFLKKRI